MKEHWTNIGLIGLIVTTLVMGGFYFEYDHITNMQFIKKFWALYLVQFLFCLMVIKNANNEDNTNT